MMHVRLHILNASGAFDPVASLIEDEFAKSTKTITTTLSISNVDVVVYDHPKGVIPEVGIGGYSPSAHLLFISLDAKSSTLTKTIREQLKRTLAHELHHCMRWRNPGWAGYTLGFDLVKKYLAKHPAESAASLVHVPAREILI